MIWLVIDRQGTTIFKVLSGCIGAHSQTPRNINSTVLHLGLGTGTGCGHGAGHADWDGGLGMSFLVCYYHSVPVNLR
jgi:hypothetical protein